ncbi:hypothetical protein CSC2_13750 [Clostridium zeae]|uniref:Uncharacterized protein n=1 Tax=Clostridium zeae TaxID=2759022 RepID=A0ABQ1E7W6_9CLOT|nr:hypothetical protein CSC2_13750 [Clostridium zeae]
MFLEILYEVYSLYKKYLVTKDEVTSLMDTIIAKAVFEVKSASPICCCLYYRVPLRKFNPYLLKNPDILIFLYMYILTIEIGTLEMIELSLKRCYAVNIKLSKMYLLHKNQM